MPERKNDDQRNADARSADTARGKEGAETGAPFRSSGSGADYSPDANWAAERERNGVPGGAAGGTGGMAGAPSGAGDGGFGPEGDFAGGGGKGAADVLAQVNGDNQRLVEEARERGPRKANRRFTGGEGVDEPDGRD